MVYHRYLTALRPLVLLLAVLTTLTTACKKSGADADPRDPYVGTYDCGYTAQTLVNNALPYGDPETGKVKVVVTKAQASDQIYLEETFPSGTKINLTAQLTNNTFKVIDKADDTVEFGGKQLAAQYVATGQFTTDNQIIITSTSTAALLGQTVVRTGSITGPKK